MRRRLRQRAQEFQKTVEEETAVPPCAITGSLSSTTGVSRFRGRVCRPASGCSRRSYTRTLCLKRRRIPRGLIERLTSVEERPVIGVNARLDWPADADRWDRGNPDIAPAVAPGSPPSATRCRTSRRRHGRLIARRTQRTACRGWCGRAAHSPRSSRGTTHGQTTVRG